MPPTPLDAGTLAHVHELREEFERLAAATIDWEEMEGGGGGGGGGDGGGGGAGERWDRDTAGGGVNSPGRESEERRVREEKHVAGVKASNSEKSSFSCRLFRMCACKIRSAFGLVQIKETRGYVGECACKEMV